MKASARQRSRPAFRVPASALKVTEGRGCGRGRNGCDRGWSDYNRGCSGPDSGSGGSNSLRRDCDRGRGGSNRDREGSNRGREGSDRGRSGSDHGRGGSDQGWRGSGRGCNGSGRGHNGSGRGWRGSDPGWKSFDPGRNRSDRGRRGSDPGRNRSDGDRGAPNSLTRFVRGPRDAHDEAAALSAHSLANHVLTRQVVFREHPVCFQNQRDGFAQVRASFFEGLALSIRAGKLLDKGDVTALWGLEIDGGQFERHGGSLLTNKFSRKGARPSRRGTSRSAAIAASSAGTDIRKVSGSLATTRASGRANDGPRMSARHPPPSSLRN